MSSYMALMETASTFTMKNEHNKDWTKPFFFLGFLVEGRREPRIPSRANTYKRDVMTTVKLRKSRGNKIKITGYHGRKRATGGQTRTKRSDPTATPMPPTGLEPVSSDTHSDALATRPRGLTIAVED